MAANTATILHKILDRKREEVIARRKRDSVGSLEQRIAEQSPARGFARALRARVAAAEPAVIAEVKKASPARVSSARTSGRHRSPRAMRRAGRPVCRCSPIPIFPGADAYLQQARAACDLPVLRKDFTVDPIRSLRPGRSAPTRSC